MYEQLSSAAQSTACPVLKEQQIYLKLKRIQRDIYLQRAGFFFNMESHQGTFEKPLCRAAVLERPVHTAWNMTI